MNVFRQRQFTCALTGDAVQSQFIRRGNCKTLFEAYLFVDWSANNSRKQGPDSIWISEGYWEGNCLRLRPDQVGCVNVATRKLAMDYIHEALERHSQGRLLVCFDFAYGYPCCQQSHAIAPDVFGLARAIGGLLTDDERNRNNRFFVADRLNRSINPTLGQGPYWGRPARGAAVQLEHLAATKPKGSQQPESLKEYRVVEERLRQRGKRAFSVWQLYGNGSVGSQVLVGLPKVHELRHAERYHKCSVIWPFETGWVTDFEDSQRIIHAEFWPGALPLIEPLHPVRDAAQVMSAVRWAAQQDAAGTLRAFFDPLEANDKEREVALREGWILGFVDKT